MLFFSKGPLAQTSHLQLKEAWCCLITLLLLRKSARLWITVDGTSPDPLLLLNLNLHCKGEDSSPPLFSKFLNFCRILSFSYKSVCRFSNLGNTCYMNAILQSLFSLSSFSNDLLKQGIQWKRVPMNALLRCFHILQSFIFFMADNPVL